jgi:hypothetical protein
LTETVKSLPNSALHVSFDRKASFRENFIWLGNEHLLDEGIEEQYGSIQITQLCAIYKASLIFRNDDFLDLWKVIWSIPKWNRFQRMGMCTTEPTDNLPWS